MIRHRRRIWVPLAALAVLATGAACGSQRPGPAPSPKASGPCAPVPGRQLVALTDDRKVQAVNNVIPAVSARSADRAVLAALDRASAALTSERLTGLNRSTDVERTAPREAARKLAATVKLTGSPPATDRGKVTIGATNVSENQSVAFLYQAALTAAGFDATVEPMGAREQYLPALQKGEIDVVPEYLGTLAEYLNTKVNGPAAKPVSSGDRDRTVAALTRLGDRVGLVFGKPAEAANQNAFAVTRAFADKYGVRTLSDLAGVCKGGAAVLGGPPDCPTSGFCQPALQKTYGIDIRRFTPLDAGGPRTKQALSEGKISIGLVFSSDAALAS